MPTKKSVSFYMEKEQQKYMSSEAIRFGLCEWYRYMFPYIPYRTGLMASLADISDSSAANVLSTDEALNRGLSAINDNIHFKAPYSSVQNGGDGFNFTRDLHPLAQAHWETVAADLHGEQIVSEIKKFVKRSDS